MQFSDIPAKFQIPFGNAAGTGYINLIPTASQIGITNGAASLTDGFPPDAFLQSSAGGAGPFGSDFNGILYQVTAWSRWQNAGATVSYDATFSTAIGGYPKGAVLAGATTGTLWLNTTDNNTTNPDSAGVGWVPLLGNNSFIPVITTGTSTAYLATLTTGVKAVGAAFALTFHVANGVAPTVNFGIGAKPLKFSKAAGLVAPTTGQIVAGMTALVSYDGTNVIVLSIDPLSVASIAAATLPARSPVTETSISANSKVTVAHGLGAVPFSCELRLRCKTADGVYIVGEEAIVPSGYSSAGIQSDTIYSVTSTDVIIRTSSGIRLQTDGGGIYNITLSSWKYVFYASL